MSKTSDLFSDVGTLAATLITTLQKQQPEAPAPSESLPPSEARPEAQEAAAAARFARIEARLDEHAARLAEMPSTVQIVGAMEQLIARMVTSLDDRFASQARSIEVLKSAAAQTDSLLERVLQSLDTLQSSEPLPLTGELVEHHE